MARPTKNGQPDEHVRGCAAHRREPADLASELLPLPDGVRDHVEQPGEAAADLALNRDRRDHEREVLRADPLGHLGERVVHRPAELRIGDHALELLAGRLLALVDDRLDPCLKLCPALSEAARVTRRSGSWSSKALIRRRRLERDPAIRDERPRRRARPGSRASSGPTTAASSASAKPQPTIRYANSAVRSGTSARSSMRWSRFQRRQVAERLLRRPEEAGEGGQPLAPSRVACVLRRPPSTAA